MISDLFSNHRDDCIPQSRVGARSAFLTDLIFLCRSASESFQRPAALLNVQFLTNGEVPPILEALAQRLDFDDRNKHLCTFYGVRHAGYD